MMNKNKVSLSILAGNYVENSTIQREIINDTFLNIRRAIDILDISSSSSPFIIADFGSAYGQNSIDTMKFIIQCLKESQKINDEKDILVIHNDLPTNNWLSLFESLKNDQSYNAVASGRSFYEQCLPMNYLNIGHSSNSLHWLSCKPCNIKNHCVIGEGDENETELFRQQSKQDFSSFLQYRSNELINGSILILSIFTTNTEQRSIQHVYGSFIYRWAQFFLTDKELFDFSIPYYFRTFNECIDTELFDQYSLELIIAEINAIKLPMFDQYRHGQLTIDQLAKQIIGSMRIWSSSSLEQAMKNNERTEDEIKKLSEQIWIIGENEIKNKPFEFDLPLMSTLLILKKK